jgi:hypothetical protein
MSMTIRTLSSTESNAIVCLPRKFQAGILE